MAQRSLILDSGALIAFARNDNRVRAHLTVARNEKADIIVPPIVVTQTIRGGAADTAINRLLKTAFVPFVGARSARVAGQLLATSGLSDAADAQVVAEALRRAPSTILTGDANHLRRLSQGLPGIHIIAM